MKKRFKSKKLNKRKLKILKIFILILCIYLFSNLTFSYLKNKKITIDNETFIKTLLNSSNNITKKQYNSSQLINDIVKLFSNIDITHPVTALNSNIASNVVKIDNEHQDNYDNIEELEKVSQYVEDPNPQEIKDPIVYIYNSHQLENYSMDNLEVYNIKPNVMMTSYMIRENLNKNNIKSIVEETNVTEILKANNFSGSSAYKVTRMLINDAKSKNKSLKYFLDIHRDSVSKDKTTIKVGEKSYARFYFVIGLENPNYTENMKFAKELDTMLNSEVKGISKGILQKQGKSVNGVYNQDISNNLLLIEVGGFENTIEEVKNSVDVLSDVLVKYIRNDKNES